MGYILNVDRNTLQRIFNMSNKQEIAVSVRNIHKEFILPQSKNTSFKQSFVNIVKNKNKVTQKVLDGITFDVKKGDFFGIVGRNGSGKSTLLKMLAGVYVPTAGEIQVNGGLTPFIELGVGFNPELSGRDNVYLNGALLGFDRKQMDAMYDGIVEFAELEPFMDQKLKNYSSGMQVRLAFSIAIKAKNEVLIFDEVLAVGDEAFQRKCLDVFEKYKAEGQTVILVTHDMDTVKEYCTRAVLISDGKLIEEGDPRRVAAEYSRLNLEEITKESRLKQEESMQSHDGLRLTTHSADKAGKVKTSFIVGEKVKIVAKWSNDVHPYAVTIDLFKNSGEHVTNFKSVRGDTSITLSEEDSSAAVEVPLLVASGRYHFSVSLRDSNDDEIGAIYHVGELIVKDDWSLVDPNRWSGLTFLPHEWSK